MVRGNRFELVDNDGVFMVKDNLASDSSSNYSFSKYDDIINLLNNLYDESIGYKEDYCMVNDELNLVKDIIYNKLQVNHGVHDTLRGDKEDGFITGFYHGRESILLELVKEI